MEIKCNFLYFQVIHFLLCKLDKEKSETLFRDCWPIFDKKMEAEFRRVCFNWYKELQVSLNIMRGSISVKFTFFVLEKKIKFFPRYDQLSLEFVTDSISAVLINLTGGRGYWFRIWF